MPEHYFSADPGVPFERETFTTELWGSTLTLDTGSGVFSRGHLDHATAVLFKELEPPVQGQFLDLGCGYGVIGLAIAKAVPLANVTGVDVNERALLLANASTRASSPACPSRCRATRSSTRSGPTRPSASARRRCTSCC
jgi:16S rRNA G1207 methylase RsmC